MLRMQKVHQSQILKMSRLAFSKTPIVTINESFGMGLTYDLYQSTYLAKRPDTFIGGQNTTRSPAKGLLEAGNSSKAGKELSDVELLGNIENDDENLKLTLRTPPNISNSNRKAANTYNERTSQPTSRINNVLTPDVDFVSDTDLEELTRSKKLSQPATPSTQRTHQSSHKRASDQRKTSTSAKHSRARAYDGKTKPKSLIDEITPTRTLFRSSRDETTYPTFGSLNHDPNDTAGWTSGGEKQLLPVKYPDRPAGGITPTRTLFRNSTDETTFPTFALGRDSNDAVDWASKGENRLFLGECLGSEDNSSTDGTVQVPPSVQTLDKGLARVSAPKSRSRARGQVCLIISQNKTYIWILTIYM